MRETRGLLGEAADNKESRSANPQVSALRLFDHFSKRAKNLAFLSFFSSRASFAVKAPVVRNSTQTQMHADHINPWSAGGTTEIANGQMLCAEYNLRKSNG